MDIKSRMKNKYFWVAAIALIVAVVKQFNPGIIPQNYEVTVNIVLTSLVTMGILLDPTSPNLMDRKE
jgi:uncharacterized membrane protein